MHTHESNVQDHIKMYIRVLLYITFTQPNLPNVENEIANMLK